ncbi:MAG: hypothetical protein IT385_09260 [Deltaproteobacteria bacterium]|nr:hypothetical protein [Deltaproteobacteria bacterium]
MRAFMTVCCVVMGGLVGGCPSKATEVVTPGPDESGPPRGERLAVMVIGEWEGEAEDGTDTKEDVELTLRADRTYWLSAGAVEMERTWSVDGDVVKLDHDPDDLVGEGGICFRGSVVSQGHLEGEWAYSDTNGQCGGEWHRVVLDRVL